MRSVGLVDKREEQVTAKDVSVRVVKEEDAVDEDCGRFVNGSPAADVDDNDVKESNVRLRL